MSEPEGNVPPWFLLQIPTWVPALTPLVMTVTWKDEPDQPSPSGICLWKECFLTAKEGIFECIVKGKLADSKYWVMGASGEGWVADPAEFCFDVGHLLF